MPIRDERGVVLVISLMVMVLLYTLGVLFLTTSATESSIARNEVTTARALGVAEAGLSHATRYLTQTAATTGLDTLLAGSTGTPVPVAALQDVTSFGADQGTYSVFVTNNTTGYKAIPADPDPENDTDNRVWITAVGTYQKASQIVRALVEVNALLDPPASIGTFDGNDAGSPVGFDFNGNAFLVTGNDTAAPESTGACGTPGAPKTGMVVESAPSLSTLESTIAPAQEDNVTGAGGNESIDLDTSLALAQIQALKATLIQLATVTLSGNVSSDIGSPTAPVIAYANDHLDLQGNGEGYGILLVERRLRMRGNFTWEGFILLIGQGEFEIEGTAAVYGGVMAANTGAYSGNSGETRVKIKGNSTVAYSSQTLCRASQLVPTTILAWHQL